MAAMVAEGRGTGRRDLSIYYSWIEGIKMAEEAKHGGQKNGKKGGLSGSSFFTWFMVIALLGVWTSVAVVWFDLVDYEEVLAKAKDFRYNLSEVLQGKLGIYDADGDGDFDVDDAKVLLGKVKPPVDSTVVLLSCDQCLAGTVSGLTKDGSNENIDSLEEVLNILAEESSDWFYGFLSFLYDIMTPFEMLEEEEEESETADGVDGLLVLLPKCEGLDGLNLNGCLRVRALGTERTQQ
ncbi:aspartyl/asparaginyl beta-hydroxylase isoform l [Camelus ferus]|nr:aspartyl/asparaginyl beta-hydroxylase isoform l [Camelus ferus]